MHIRYSVHYFRHWFYTFVDFPFSITIFLPGYDFKNSNIASKVLNLSNNNLSIRQVIEDDHSTSWLHIIGMQKQKNWQHSPLIRQIDIKSQPAPHLPTHSMFVRWTVSTVFSCIFCCSKKSRFCIASHMRQTAWVSPKACLFTWVYVLISWCWVQEVFFDTKFACNMNRYGCCTICHDKTVRRASSDWAGDRMSILKGV